MNNSAVEALQQKRIQIERERNEAISKFNQQISELETAIETLSGKKVWETSPQVLFDDENPDYIKASREEI